VATVIDELIVKLGLDSASFKQGSAEATKAQSGFVDQARRQGAELENINKKSAAAQTERAKELDARAKTAAESFAKIRNQALSLFAVFTAGKSISGFTSDTISSTAALSRLSDNVGIGIDRLAAYGLAAKNAGSSAEGMMALINKASNEATLRRTRGEIAPGVQAAYQYGSQYSSIVSEDFKDAETWLLKQAEILHTAKMKGSEQEAIAIAQKMGIAREEANFLMQGRVAIQQRIDDAKSLTGVTEAQGESSKDLAEKWNNLKAVYDSTGRTVLFKLAPYLDWLISKGREFDNWLKSDEFKKWLEESGKSIEDFLRDSDEFVQSIGGWKTVLTGLLALKVAEFVAPLLLLTGALTGVSTALTAVTAAAAAGYGVGKYINDLLPDDFKDKAGEWTARLLATFGNEDAKKALIASGDAPQQSISEGFNELKNNVGGYFDRKRAEQAAKFFESKGWTKEQAAGIVANLKAESDLKDDAKGDGGKAYGVAQWHPDRQAKFKEIFGHDITKSGLREQLEFVDWELRNTEAAAGRKLKAAKTRAEATDAVQIHYERPDPKNRERDTAKRQAIAASLGRDTQSPARQAMESRYLSSTTNNNNPVSNNSTSETKIGQVVINTAATDAKRIAAEIFPAIERQTQVFNAASGMRQ
jgi:hypothetical protein